jgi:hypothetical protein
MQDEYALTRLFKEHIEKPGQSLNRKLSAQALRPKEGLRMTVVTVLETDPTDQRS